MKNNDNVDLQVLKTYSFSKAAILIDKFEEVIFVTLDMVESEGQLWLLQKAYSICRFVIRSM